MRGLNDALRSGARCAVMCGLGAVLALGLAIAPAAARAAVADSSIVMDDAGEGAYKLYRLFSAEFVPGEDGRLHMEDALVNDSYRQALLDTFAEVGHAVQLDQGMDAQTASDALSAALLAVGEEGRGVAFANALAARVASLDPTARGTAHGDVLTVNGLDSGYYLIISDPNDADFDNTGNTAAILAPVSGESHPTTKASVPSVAKEVKDAGDSWDAAFGPTADAGLTDGALSGLTYRITGTVPENIDAYGAGSQGARTFHYAFVDELPIGVDVTEAELASWKVSIACAGKDLTGSFYAKVSTDAATRTSTVEWGTDDLKGALLQAGIAEEDMAGVEITLTYDPVFDAGDIERLYAAAASLDAPQTNAVRLVYSKSPYADGWGETPERQTSVYSYGLRVSKLDDEAQALEGAEFSLTVSEGTRAGRQLPVTDRGDEFLFTGLESDVEYVLTETTAPEGKTLIQPVKFKVLAQRDAQGRVTGIECVETSDPSNAATFGAASDRVSATAQVSVVNLSEPDLPLTGGAGIQAPVAAGGALMAVSAFAMIRRKANEQVEE